MSVHQLKDGRWIVQYRIPGQKSKKREYFGRGPLQEQSARTRDRELGRRAVRKSSPLFRDLADAYLAAKVGSIQQTSIDALRYKLSGVINPLLGHLRAYSITRDRMDAYVGERLKTPLRTYTGGKESHTKKVLLDHEGHPRYISRSTVHREATDIMAILNWAANRGYLTRNPLAGYQKPKRDDRVVTPPSTEEVKRLLAVAPDHLARALTVSYYTGLRPGLTELLRIRWEDVDLEEQTILVRSSRKGGPASRRVPCMDEFTALLREWKEEDGDLEYVIHYRGKPIKRISKSFATAKRKAGIRRRLPPYSIRHRFATALLARSADLKATSEILGHSRPDTTMRIYQHTDTALHRDAISRLPSLKDDDD